MVTVIGSYISPYVRKLLVCLQRKGIAYEIDPIIPYFGNDEFSRISPLRRIPVLIDGDVTLADSTVICEYLEDRYPQPPLLPASPALRARSRWLEEYADSRLGEVLIWGLFDQKVIRRYVWNEAPDQERLQRSLERDIPELLDYLEMELPEQGFLFGFMGVADIAIASFFRNAAFAGFHIEAGHWPRAAAFVRRLLDQPEFAQLRRFEELAVRTPIPRHREVLGAAGAPLTQQTFGTPAPRRGILRT